MKRILLAASFCLAFSCVIQAQQTAADSPATKEDVQKYLLAVHSHEMMLKMLDVMSKPVHQVMHEEYLKNKENLPPDFETRMQKTLDDMVKNLPFDEMMEAMVPAYQKHFTKGDMDALVAFYSGPTGQKILQEMPAIMAESMQSMMPIMRKHMDAINERLRQEMAKEYQKRPASKSPAT